MEIITEFEKNNPYSKIENETKHLKINKPWDDSTFIVLLDKKEDLSRFKNVVLVDYLAAIYHLKEKRIEFIFGPVETTNEIIKRKFDFNYNGDTFKCYFDKSSKTLELLAKGFQPLESPSRTNYRELRMFNDYFTIEEQPDFIKEFFKDSEPYSFYLEGDLEKYSTDFSYLLRLLNFYLAYFDRETPQVILFKKEKYSEEFNPACYFDKTKQFPDSINARQLDFTVLETLDIANKTDDIRLQFIFYFQVLEYCSYYYLDNSIKKELGNILKKPDINSNSNEYTKSIIEKLQDHFYRFKNDSDKMEKLIFDHCSIEDIRLELESNCDFFCQDVEFDGGLIVKKLFNKKEDIQAINEATLSAIRKNIERIRNVLVHLREQRENKVILPTPDNNKKLIPYIFLVRRIAEKIAIQYD